MSFEHYHPSPGHPVHLSDYDPNDKGGYERAKAEETTKQLRNELRDLQECLFAEQNQSLLIVLQAMDAGGKDGTIKSVFQGVNPQGVRVASFKRPTEIELAHDFLWRIHQQVPPKGYIAIFNRSHYEDVLVARVNQLVPQDVIEQRYEQINHFEALLAANNTRIVKFYLNISKDEQKERFQKRLDNPNKHWKFSLGDLPVREQWHHYMHAFEIALTQCNTEVAPWYIIPANRKWYRNLVIMTLIVQTLREMNPQFPTPTDDLSNVIIPD